MATIKQLIAMARECVADCGERHAYMPSTPLLAETWQPHRWVLDAMLMVAHEAEQERDRFKAGNTTLLEALMHEHAAAPDAEPMRVEALREAGMLDDDGLLWSALEARKPKQQTWEEAVRECVTDPAEVERLLNLDNDATAEEKP